MVLMSSGTWQRRAKKRLKHGLGDGRTWRYRLGTMLEADEVLETVMVKHESLL